MNDREKLIELLQYGMDKYFLLKFESEIIADLLVKNGVTVQKHGRWEHLDDDLVDLWKCTACGEEWAFAYDPTSAETAVNYCPNCGARTEGE